MKLKYTTPWALYRYKDGKDTLKDFEAHDPSFNAHQPDLLVYDMDQGEAPKSMMVSAGGRSPCPCGHCEKWLALFPFEWVAVFEDESRSQTKSKAVLVLLEEFDEGQFPGWLRSYLARGVKGTPGLAVDDTARPGGNVGGVAPLHQLLHAVGDCGLPSLSVEAAKCLPLSALRTQLGALGLHPQVKSLLYSQYPEKGKARANKRAKVEGQAKGKGARIRLRKGDESRGCAWINKKPQAVAARMKRYDA